MGEWSYGELSPQPASSAELGSISINYFDGCRCDLVDRRLSKLRTRQTRTGSIASMRLSKYLFVCRHIFGEKEGCADADSGDDFDLRRDCVPPVQPNVTVGLSPSTGRSRRGCSGVLFPYCLDRLARPSAVSQVAPAESPAAIWTLLPAWFQVAPGFYVSRWESCSAHT